MKALSYVDYSRLEMTEEPIPSPAADEALVRVAACGICGSELEAFRKRSPRRPPPLIMGHEFCGTIEEIGADVSGVTLGQRVVSNSLIACGACASCAAGATHLCEQRQLFGMHRPGGFAEYVAVPVSCLSDWPETLSAEAACLAEPLANGIHMADMTSHLRLRTVLVIGAGPIGLMTQQVFQVLRGCAVIVADLSPDRLAVARQLGARSVINPRDTDLLEACLAQTGGRGADMVVDAVGSAITKKQSIAATRPGGAAVWIGLHEDTIPIDSYGITLMERQVLGSYAATLPQLERAVGMLRDGQVQSDSWVKTFPLSQSKEGFERMLAAQGDDIKAVIVPEP